MLSFKFVVLIFLNLGFPIFAQQFEGYICVRNYDRKIGTCTRKSLCPSAQIILEKLGIRPDICGRSGVIRRGEEVICCVERTQSTIEYNTIPFTVQTTIPTTEVPKIRLKSDFASNKRLHEINCEKYSSLVQRQLTFSTLAFNSRPQTLTVPKCNFQNTNINPLVVGGQVVRRGEFPHMTAVGWTQSDGNIKWNCGGTLISEKFVMTAGHCTLKFPDIVRIGEHNLVSTNDGATPVDIVIKRIIRHPDYVGSKYNDISLIELSEPVSFGEFVRPACLWDTDAFNSTSAIATGWGNTEFNGPSSDVLMKVALNIVSNEECAPLYKSIINRKLSNGIINTQLCAGDVAGNKDACQGDSGGPLQIPNDENPCIFYIIGVTSFGRGCGVADSPGVYTRVSKYIDWIEKEVWGNE